MWLNAHSSEDIVLNVTGGTKPMAIVAQELFRMAGKPVFYVDIASDAVWWLDSGETSPQWKIICKLQHPIELDTFLHLNGYKANSKTETYQHPEWYAMAEAFARNALKWQNAITVLNSLAQAAEKAGSLYPPVEATKKSFRELKEMLDELQKRGLTATKTENGNWHFTSVEARNFAHGGWLEYYVFYHLTKLYPNKGMTFLNTEIQKDEQPPNEIDVLSVYRNNLYAFECKTRNFTEKDSASDAIYKLDSLKEKLGKLRGTGIIVSYRTLNVGDKKRASGYGLKLIGPEDLLPDKLPGKLRELLKMPR